MEEPVIVETIDSTNAELLRRLSKGEKLHKTALIAYEQTAGRGRTGRRFYSPKNTGVYFSFVYEPRKELVDPALITARAAVGVCRAIGSQFNVTSGIKWVNDIYVNGKKVCGILVEGYVNPQSEKVEAVVVGIGINISMDTSDAPEEFELSGAGGIVPYGTAPLVMRELLAKDCINRIYKILDDDEDVMDEYRKRSVILGKTVTVHPLALEKSEEQSYQAVAVDIADDASLIVQLGDGSQKLLHSGEVSLTTF